MIANGRVFAAAGLVAASLAGLAACSSTTSSAAEQQWKQDASACDQIQDATQRQTCQANASARFQTAAKAERKAQAACPSGTC